MKRHSLALFTFFILNFIILSQRLPGQITISGFVKDKHSGEVIIGANIYCTGQKVGTTTDNNGYFNIILDTPSEINVSYVGYTSENYNIAENQEDTVLHIFLSGNTELDEVVVHGLRKNQFNVISLNNKELMNLPALGGKPDIMKSLQLMPGIQPQKEGRSLILVRGGDPGQNLYLFDNVSVIYVNHLGGFTSVFNPEIINNIDVYKGNFPARYGGKLSSIVDITQKTGDNTRKRKSISIGLTDMSFSIEGPLKNKKSTYIITGRKTMIDGLMYLVSSLADSDYFVSYGFHDINAKFTHKPNKRNNIFVNFYQGDDYLFFWSNPSESNDQQTNRISNIWGNLLTSVSWQHAFSSGVCFNSSVSFSKYRLKNKQLFTIPLNNSVYKSVTKKNSSVEDFSVKSALKWNPVKFWNIKTGLHLSYLNHQPNILSKKDMDIQSSLSSKSVDAAVYIENSVQLNSYFKFYPGIRFDYYHSDDFSDISIEPRIDLIMNVSPDQKLNLNFTKMSQKSHLIFTHSNIMNNEIWIPSDAQIPPSQSCQYSLGWEGSFRGDRFRAELVTYYKKMENLATLREGYSYMWGDTNWKNKIESSGQGISYGFESFIELNHHTWNGFIGYSYSHSVRQFNTINNGKKYVFDYDRPHNLSLYLSGRINRNLQIYFNWVYQTGLPYTQAIGKHFTPSLIPDENDDYFYYDALIYGNRNNARMKDYHRLDIGATYTYINKRKRKVVWTFSVYNVYNRHNPYFYYYNTNVTGEMYTPESGIKTEPVSLYQMCFFPIIPSVSYKVYFENNNREKSQNSFVERLINWLSYE
jgi:hypothetical protein